MFKNFKRILSVVLIFNIIFSLNISVFAATEESPKCRFCDFSQMYVGNDKYEKFNRKMFNLNSKLNKYVAKPVHILWASIFPQYGLDRIQGIYNNIEYPKRLASCLIQKDFKGAKNETKRFLANTTIGLGGMFDPAKKFLKIQPVSENMDQALCHCNVKSGGYLVMPVLSSSSPRSLLGRLIEAALDPSVYIGSPITAIVKFGLVVNKTSYMQPLIQLIESTYADPYDIAKKMYGIENYIKTQNLDRQDLLSTDAKILNTENSLEDEIIANIQDKRELSLIKDDLDKIKEEESLLNSLDELADGNLTGAACKIEPDILLKEYKSQSPVVDSMRTALFDDEKINKSMWNELSVWNHSFARRIKTSSVNIVPDRENYKYRYILQRNKKSPVAIIYPSVGEGINSHHSVVFAKILYDAGYSVIIQGSHFQWEFAKSMPSGFCPGLPSQDASYLKLVTSKILDDLKQKHNCEFNEKILIGTSFGAMATLFVADKESKDKSLGISKYIAMSPPIELVYALEQVDKNSEAFENSNDDTKHKTAITAAKILQILEQKNSPNFKFTEMPFSEEEGKLIVSFLLRQKLSDLIFTLENIDKKAQTDFYTTMNNISYKDYAEKYLLKENGSTLDDIKYDTSLYSIAEFLKNNKNYKIYHSLDDFFINKKQLEQLKLYSPQNIVFLDKGSHLGYLYRKEFLSEFKKDILLN